MLAVLGTEKLKLLFNAVLETWGNDIDTDGMVLQALASKKLFAAEDLITAIFDDGHTDKKE